MDLNGNSLYLLKFEDGIIVSSEDTEKVFLIIRGKSEDLKLTNGGYSEVVNITIKNRTVREFSENREKLKRFIEIFKNLERREKENEFELKQE
jgi:hypothetical protein